MQIDKKLEKYLKEWTYQKQPEWEEIKKLLDDAEDDIQMVYDNFEKNLKRLSFNALVTIADEENEFWDWIRERENGGYDNEQPLFDRLIWFSEDVAKISKIKQAVEKIKK
jgi:hypothetical protein